MSECLQNLAAQHGIELDENSAAEFLTDQRTRRAAAYVTYGQWLILRLTGESDGPAMLALWRLIAWDPRGGIRHGFKL